MLSGVFGPHTNTFAGKKKGVWRGVSSLPVSLHPLWGPESAFTLSLSLWVIIYAPVARSSRMECGESLEKNSEQRRGIFEGCKKRQEPGRISNGDSATARHTSTPKKGQSKPLCASSEFSRCGSARFVLIIDCSAWNLFGLPPPL